MNDNFKRIQELAFGKSLINESKTTKSALVQKIKEIALNEKKKNKKDVAPSDDNVEAEISTSEEEITDDSLGSETKPDISMGADIDPTIKDIQDNLQKAFAGAQKTGDEKLINQIGNTLTMLVRTQVLAGQQVTAEGKK